jgi:hypothetical protein
MMVSNRYRIFSNRFLLGASLYFALQFLGFQVSGQPLSIRSIDIDGKFTIPSDNGFEVRTSSLLNSSTGISILRFSKTHQLFYVGFSGWINGLNGPSVRYSQVPLLKKNHLLPENAQTTNIEPKYIDLCYNPYCSLLSLDQFFICSGRDDRKKREPYIAGLRHHDQTVALYHCINRLVKQNSNFELCDIRTIEILKGLLHGGSLSPWAQMVSVYRNQATHESGFRFSNINLQSGKYHVVVILDPIPDTTIRGGFNGIKLIHMQIEQGVWNRLRSIADDIVDEFNRSNAFKAEDPMDFDYGSAPDTISLNPLSEEPLGSYTVSTPRDLPTSQ